MNLVSRAGLEPATLCLKGNGYTAKDLHFCGLVYQGYAKIAATRAQKTGVAGT